MTSAARLVAVTVLPLLRAGVPVAEEVVKKVRSIAWNEPRHVMEPPCVGFKASCGWGEVSWVMERGEEKLTAEDIKRMRQNKDNGDELDAWEKHSSKGKSIIEHWTPILASSRHRLYPLAKLARSVYGVMADSALEESDFSVLSRILRY